MGARKRLEAYIHPIGHRPFKEPAQLDYRDKSELCTQLKQYARGVWTTARRLDVDPRSQEILADGQVVAKYALHEPRRPAAQDGQLL